MRKTELPLAALFVFVIQGSVGAQWLLFGGHEYRLTETELSWQDAEAEAILEGGHLVAIGSAEENQWVLENLAAEENCWIGLHQQTGASEPAGGFVWSNGEPVVYTNWLEGEPNNDLNAGGEDCVEIKAVTAIPQSRAGLWNDQHCVTVIRRGIIERELNASPECSKGQPIVFREGSNGYFEACHTTIGMGRDCEDVVSSDQNEEGLLLFDRIFGPGGIPPGARIISATLTVYAADGTIDGTTTVHHALEPWCAEGCPQGRPRVSEPILVIDAPIRVGERSIDVTSSLQLWSGGSAPNYGWLFRQSSTDGWEFYSPLHRTIERRPRLTVCFGPPEFTRGDSNIDGKFDLRDPVHTLLFLFSGHSQLRCQDASDSDDNGKLDLLDVIRSLKFLFFGGTSLPAPFRECGSDPTSDNLSCAQSSAICA